LRRDAQASGTTLATPSGSRTGSMAPRAATPVMEGWDLDEARAAADGDAFLAMLMDRGLLESA
jgi:hypothetical protein